MIKKNVFITAIFIFFSSISSFAERVITTPTILYHWTSVESINQISQSAGDSLPLKRIAPGFMIAIIYRELANLPALFTWSHPVTGIGAAPTEIYGGEILLAIHINPLARVLVLNTSYDLIGKENSLNDINIDQYDLIYHELEVRGNTVMKEWIILNPDAVVNFTADPLALSCILNPELDFLRSGGNYRPEDQHFLGNTLFSPVYIERLVIPAIEKFLSLEPTVVPLFFRQSNTDCFLEAI